MTFFPVTFFPTQIVTLFPVTFLQNYHAFALQAISKQILNGRITFGHISLNYHVYIWAQKIAYY